MISAASAVEITERRMGKFIAVSFAIIAVVAVATSLLFPPPPIPINTADGVYINERCGIVTLSGGALRWENNKARYTLGSNNMGLFALVDHEIGIGGGRTGCYLTISPKMNILLAPGARPTTLTVIDAKAAQEVTFQRAVSPSGTPTAR